MRVVFRSSYPFLPPSLCFVDRGGHGDRYCPPATFSIRRFHSLGKKFPILAGKPASKGEDREEEETTNGEAPASEDMPTTAQVIKNADLEGGARKSVWRRLQLGLGLGFQNEGALVSADSGDMEIQWGDIVDPTPENLLALLLTGLLGLAILQIFWQLLLVAITITLAALKYSVIAGVEDCRARGYSLYYSYFVDYDNIMSFCRGGTAYLARCSWGQGFFSSGRGLLASGEFLYNSHFVDYDNIMSFCRGGT